MPSASDTAYPRLKTNPSASELGESWFIRQSWHPYLENERRIPANIHALDSPCTQLTHYSFGEAQKYRCFLTKQKSEFTNASTVRALKAREATAAGVKATPRNLVRVVPPLSKFLRTRVDSLESHFANGLRYS